MRILLTNQALADRAGSESYLETIAVELLQLGHDVVVWSPMLGGVAAQLEADGCMVSDDLEKIADVDVVHAQHASTALAVRARFPGVPMVFASHSWSLDVEDPPALASPAVLLAFNDTVLTRLQASELGERIPIHRLRQPVAMYALDNRREPIREQPLTAVAIGRDLGVRVEMLDAACRACGIRLDVYGRDNALADPTAVMMESDIVFAVGRTALEAMVLARAAFVFGESGSAGFINAERYPELESIGFTPAASPPMSVEGIIEELRRYDRSLGALGRELTGRHHIARAHAAELVAIYTSVLDAPVPVRADRDAVAELAALTQRNFVTEQQARAAEWDRARARQREVRLQIEIDKIRSSMSWRVTRPLRSFRRVPAPPDSNAEEPVPEKPAPEE